MHFDALLSELENLSDEDMNRYMALCLGWREHKARRSVWYADTEGDIVTPIIGWSPVERVTHAWTIVNHFIVPSVVVSGGILNVRLPTPIFTDGKLLWHAFIKFPYEREGEWMIGRYFLKGINPYRLVCVLAAFIYRLQKEGVLKALSAGEAAELPPPSPP